MLHTWDSTFHWNPTEYEASMTLQLPVYASCFEEYSDLTAFEFYVDSAKLDWVTEESDNIQMALTREIFLEFHGRNIEVVIKATDAA